MCPLLRLTDLRGDVIPRGSGRRGLRERAGCCRAALVLCLRGYRGLTVSVAGRSRRRADVRPRSPLVLAAALLTASCGGSPERAQAPQPVRFGHLNGVVYGAGNDGVVLASQSDRGREAWAPFARYLAAHGLRVLAFDYYGENFPEEEVAAAAGELRRVGARQIVLVGASKGARAAIMAGAEAPGGVVGIVALSAERYAQPHRDVLPSARRLALPALFVTARNDPFSAYDTPLLERAATATQKRLLVVPGDAHGIDLTSRTAVRAAILAFLRQRL
jgi:hypothetical protein